MYINDKIGEHYWGNNPIIHKNLGDVIYKRNSRSRAERRERNDPQSAGVKTAAAQFKFQSTLKFESAHLWLLNFLF